MTRSARVAVLAAAVGTALAATGSAFAAFSPFVYVKAATGGGANIRVATAPGDDPTSRFALYTPTGSTATLTAAPGTSLGKVVAHAAAADLGGAILPLAGDVLVANPADPAIVAAGSLCDPVAHLGILVLNLQAAGQTLNVPMFVDQSAGAEAAFSAQKLTVCLPPPDIPAGTPGRAMFGAKLLDAEFTITTLTGPAGPGEQRWRSLWTPYTPGTGQPNAAGTVETQGLVRSPTELLIASRTVAKKTTKKVKGKKVTKTQTLVGIAARLVENQIGISGIKVTFQGSLTPNESGFSSVLASKTDKDGIAAIAFELLRTAYFRATATIPDRDLGASACTASFGVIPCIHATVSGQTLTTKTVKITLRH